MKNATDPLTLAMAPPPAETPAQRIERENKEHKAREISWRIDEEIRAERVASKKRKKPVKVLVIGQSESGKSTTIKNFQRKLAPRLWDSERASWRAVIFLNLVYSVNTILNVLTDEMPDTGSRDMSHGPKAQEKSTPTFTSQHRLLKLRLGPLHQIQNDLETLLGLPPASVSMVTGIDLYDPASIPETIPLYHEFRVVSRQGWKSILDKVKDEQKAHLPDHVDDDIDPRRNRALRRGAVRTEDVADVIACCAADIKALWADSVVQGMLRKCELTLEDWAGFFLNDVDRIASRQYIPSDDDIMHARLQTLGLQEYRFDISGEVMGTEKVDEQLPAEWVLYDVAGVRTSRAAWIPYFDDINSIIFLAPISAFDQVLAEDRSVNRLQDSLSLWKSVCASKVIHNVQLILLLNKCDVLQRKLKEGRKVSEWVKAFPNHINDYEGVLKHFNHMFKHILMQHSPKRLFYVHFTSVVKIKATAATLASIQDSIIEHMMTDASLI